MTAIAVAVAAVLAVSSPEGGNATPTRSQAPQATSTVGGGSRVAAAAQSTQMGPVQSAGTQVQRINLELRTTEKIYGEEQPRYVPVGSTAASLKGWTGHLTVKLGRPVVLTIINTDDGAAPLAPGYRQFDSVQGGAETVEGKPVSYVPNSQIAHTFTALGLDVNAAIPAAPEGGTDTIVLKFTPTKAGTFPWQCFAPCGTWSNGFGAAMDKPGWMQGKITVLS